MAQVSLISTKYGPGIAYLSQIWPRSGCVCADVAVFLWHLPPVLVIIKVLVLFCREREDTTPVDDNGMIIIIYNEENG